MPLVGARASDSIEITVTGAPGFDFSQVNVLDLLVRRPDGSDRAWPWTIASATPTELNIVHEFAADGSDARTPGKYRVHGWVRSPAGERRIKVVVIPFTPYP